jgi:hypothetical protein
MKWPISATVVVALSKPDGRKRLILENTNIKQGVQHAMEVMEKAMVPLVVRSPCAQLIWRFSPKKITAYFR